MKLFILAALLSIAVAAPVHEDKRNILSSLSGILGGDGGGSLSELLKSLTGGGGGASAGGATTGGATTAGGALTQSQIGAITGLVDGVIGGIGSILKSGQRHASHGGDPHVHGATHGAQNAILAGLAQGTLGKK